MIESMTTEVIAVSKLASHGMAPGETASADHVDSSGVVSERQIDRRSAPYAGDNAGREDRAAQIDAIVIAEADSEAGIPGFAPAQRNPAHRIRHAHYFDTADKGNQRWSIDRGYRDRSRRPSPKSADVDPTAIMERSITPGSVVNPGPSPRRHETPMAKAVGSPVGHHTIREPHIAVNRSRSPHAGHIEIDCAHHARRDGPHRDGICGPGVTLRAPGVELVGFRDAVLVIARGISLNHHFLVVIQRGGLTVGRSLAAAGANPDHCGVAGFIDLDAIQARPQQREGYL